MKYEIDINCDLGEGLGNEADLLPYLSSCSIACGGHAGDERVLTEVIRLAKENSVKIGAHPSYPDRANFGRVSMKLAEQELLKCIQEQLTLFTRIAKSEQVPMHHIKPHGALYNDIAWDKDLAGLFLHGVEAYKEEVKLYLPFGSVAVDLAVKNGFDVVPEAFADRNYNADLSLVSRKHPEALLINPQEILDRLVRIVAENELMAIDGRSVSVRANTFCIHGDTPNVLQILMYLSAELPKHNILIKK